MINAFGTGCSTELLASVLAGALFVALGVFCARALWKNRRKVRIVPDEERPQDDKG